MLSRGLYCLNVPSILSVGAMEVLKKNGASLDNHNWIKKKNQFYGRQGLRCFKTSKYLKCL